MDRSQDSSCWFKNLRALAHTAGDIPFRRRAARRTL